MPGLNPPDAVLILRVLFKRRTPSGKTFCFGQKLSAGLTYTDTRGARPHHSHTTDPQTPVHPPILTVDATRAAEARPPRGFDARGRYQMTRPEEATRTRVGHTKRDETDVYIGRGPGGRDMLSTPVGDRGWLGNPHTVEDHGREGCIKRFRKAFVRRLEDDPEFRARVRDLAGKTLGCWCQGVDEDGPACHGEVIAEHADRLVSDNGGGGGGE